MQDLKSEVGNFLKNELLGKRTSPQRVGEIINKIEIVLTSYPQKNQNQYYELSKVGVEFPEINSVIVKYLASL